MSQFAAVVILNTDTDDAIERCITDDDPASLRVAVIAALPALTHVIAVLPVNTVVTLLSALDMTLQQEAAEQRHLKLH